jgi:DNA-binding beta-propeller fold protein YncE
VANLYSNNLSVIDRSPSCSGVCHETVDVGERPVAVAVNPITDKIYVANEDSSTVTVLDGKTGLSEAVNIAGEPLALAVNPTTNKVYVAPYPPDHITVIDGANHTSTIPVEFSGPFFVAVNPKTNRVYLTDYDNVKVIDGATDTVMETVPTGRFAYAIEIDEALNQIYVANLEGNNVTVINGLTYSTTTLAVGKGPRALAVNPETHRVYVADGDSNEVSVIAAAHTQILLAGGTNWTGEPLDTAEIWDAATQTTTEVGRMTSPRFRHTATASADGGRTLIAGGQDASLAVLKTAEVYDGAKGLFTATGPMTTPRYAHTATLLPKANKVLIAGGCCAGDGSAWRTAELYDFASGTFTQTGSMTQPRMNATATLLADGRVLIAGGAKAAPTLPIGEFSLREAEIYDPATGTFTATGKLNNPRQAATAALLNDGQVLIAGGWTVGDDPSGTAELYTPESGTFTRTANMSVGRRYAASSRLEDGRVLVAGGDNGANYGQVFDPDSKSWGLDVFMTEARELPTATFLFSTDSVFDGGVLVAGGVIPNTGTSGGKLLELYDPQTDKFQPAGEMTTPRAWMTATPVSLTLP